MSFFKILKNVLHMVSGALNNVTWSFRGEDFYTGTALKLAVKVGKFVSNLLSV